jgi:hypothetical protein
MCSEQSRPIDRGSHILGAEDKKQQVGMIYLKPDGVASSAESPHGIAAGEVRHGSGLCIKPGASTAPSWPCAQTDRRHHSPRPAAACGGGSSVRVGKQARGASQETVSERRGGGSKSVTPWPRRAPAT